MLAFYSSSKVVFPWLPTQLQFGSKDQDFSMRWSIPPAKSVKITEPPLERWFNLREKHVRKSK